MIDAAAPGVFTAWRRIAAYAALRTDLGGDEDALVGVFRRRQRRTGAGRPCRDGRLGRHRVGRAGDPARVGRGRLDRRAGTAPGRHRDGHREPHRGAVPGWPTGRPPARPGAGHRSDQVRQGAAGRRPWAAAAKPLQDGLRDRRRAALVAYLVATLGMDSPDRLFEHFLLDVEITAAVPTARIKQAMASVQLFVQRCLLNLDPAVPPKLIDAVQWRWRSDSGSGRPNREVMLFAENWCDPGLRDDKTPLYAALESQLLQGEMTPDNVEHAFRTYLDGLEELTRLDISAIVPQVETDGGADARLLHVFGRTFAEPYAYYRRTLSGGTVWSPWQQSSRYHRPDPDPGGVEPAAAADLAGVQREVRGRPRQPGVDHLPQRRLVPPAHQPRRPAARPADGALPGGGHHLVGQLRGAATCCWSAAKTGLTATRWAAWQHRSATTPASAFQDYRFFRFPVPGRHGHRRGPGDGSRLASTTSDYVLSLVGRPRRFASCSTLGELRAGGGVYTRSLIGCRPAGASPTALHPWGGGRAAEPASQHVPRPAAPPTREVPLGTASWRTCSPTQFAAMPVGLASAAKERLGAHRCAARRDRVEPGPRPRQERRTRCTPSGTVCCSYPASSFKAGVGLDLGPYLRTTAAPRPGVRVQHSSYRRTSAEFLSRRSTPTANPALHLANQQLRDATAATTNSTTFHIAYGPTNRSTTRTRGGMSTSLTGRPYSVYNWDCSSRPAADRGAALPGRPALDEAEQ